MSEVFILQHEYEWCDRDEVKFIGVYATYIQAEKAINRLQDKPGFQNWPDGFSIERYEIGTDHWEEGFAIIIPILTPSSVDNKLYQIAGSVWHPGDLYKIIDISDPENTIFEVGDVVQCEELAVEGHGDSALVASNVVKLSQKNKHIDS